MYGTTIVQHIWYSSAIPPVKQFCNTAGTTVLQYSWYNTFEIAQIQYICVIPITSVPRYPRYNSSGIQLVQPFYDTTCRTVHYSRYNTSKVPLLKQICDTSCKTVLQHCWNNRSGILTVQQFCATTSSTSLQCRRYSSSVINIAGTAVLQYS